MRLIIAAGSLACVTLLAATASGAVVPLDLQGIRPGPVVVTDAEDAVTVTWPDETGRLWRATFSLDPETPLIRSIAVGDAVIVSGARPYYQGETGTRRGGWNAFFDYPPDHPDGTRSARGVFSLRSATARTIGERVEILFDGLHMGVFDGGIAYTVYPGSRLIHQEAVLSTDVPDVAYYYDAGLEMAARADLTPGRNMRTRVSYYDTAGALREDVATGFDPERVPVKVRYRTLAMETDEGSVAVFPTPHQYFFPRDFTSNLGQLWHRSWRGSRVARHPTDRGHQLAFLSVDERPTGTAATDVGLLPALGRHPGADTRRCPRLHQPRSVPARGWI